MASRFAKRVADSAKKAPVVPISHELAASNGFGSVLLGESLRDVRLDLIDPSPYQYRFYFDRNEDRLLSESMAGERQYSPVILRPKQNGRFELIAGHRRVEEARGLGWEAISSVVKTGLTDVDAAVMVFGENQYRVEPTDIEIALGIQNLVDRKVFELASHAFARCGVSKSRGYRAMTLLALPLEFIDLAKSNPRRFTGLMAENIKKALASSPVEVVLKSVQAELLKPEPPAEPAELGAVAAKKKAPRREGVSGSFHVPGFYRVQHSLRGRDLTLRIRLENESGDEVLTAVADVLKGKAPT